MIMMEMSRWKIKGNNYNFITDVQLFQLLFVLLGLFNLSVCLFEDQIGKFDWKQNYVGKLKFSQFDTVSAARKIILATEENVVAALHLKSGQLIWRQVLERTNRSHIDFLHVDNEVVTISTEIPWGPYLVRGWEPLSGGLLWEWSLSLTKSEKAPIKVEWLVSHGRLIHIVTRAASLIKNKLMSTLELTSYNIKNGNSRGFSKQVQADWIENPHKCVLQAPYYVCLTENKIAAINIVVESSEAKTSTLSLDLNSLFSTVQIEEIEIVPVKGSLSILSVKQKDVTKLVHIDDSGIYVIPSEFKIDTDFLTVPYGDKNCVVQLNHVNEEEIEISGTILDEGAHRLDTEFNNRIAYPSTLGRATFSSGFCTVRKDKGNVCRFLVGTDDDAIVLLPNSGKVLWNREESLVHITAVDMLDLPVSDLDASIETEFDNKANTNLLDMLTRRLTSQASQLRSLILTVFGLAAPPSKSQAAGLVRDEFGLHKMIVAVTNVGKLFGIDNRNGEILWQRRLDNIKPFHTAGGKSHMQLLVQRTTRHFPYPAQCVLLAQDKITSKGIIFTFNPITGAPIDEGFVRLDYYIKQVLLLPEGDAESLRGILILDDQNNVHVKPKSAKSILDKYINKLYLYTVDSNQGVLIGYTLAYSSEKNLIATPIWDIQLNSKGQQIVDVVGKNPLERVHSQGRVLADRSVLFKYVNPNLVAVLTQTLDPIHKHILSIYLVDVVSGSIVFTISHRRARAPFHVVHSENWLAYSYFNDKWRRTEVATLELYEGKVQSNSTSFSSWAAPKSPMVERQAFIMPATILTMKETITEKGITSKHVLMALSNGGVLEMPWMFLDPRRPITMTAEEGVVPYMPELPVASEAMLNYNQTILCPHGILTVPSGLESTSLVLVHGLDIFYTRVSPSKTFDLLKDDFDYYLITIVLLGLAAASYVTRYLASRKALKQAWK